MEKSEFEALRYWCGIAFVDLPNLNEISENDIKNTNDKGEQSAERTTMARQKQDARHGSWPMIISFRQDN